MVIQSVLGDLVIVSSLLLSTLSLLISPKIWRLYVVYGKRFWVFIPPLLLVTSYTGMVFSFRVVTLLSHLTGPLAVGSVAILYFHRARPGTNLNIFNVAKPWITAYFSMTMSFNIICSGEHPLASFPPWLCLTRFPYATGAIAVRILFAWKSQTEENLHALPYWKIVVIIIESSALYALGVLAALVSFVCDTNGQYAAVDAIVPLVVSSVSYPPSINVIIVIDHPFALRASYSVSSRSKSAFMPDRQAETMSSTHEGLPPPGRPERDCVKISTPRPRSVSTSRCERSRWRFTWRGKLPIRWTVCLWRAGTYTRTHFLASTIRQVDIRCRRCISGPLAPPTYDGFRRI